MRILSIITLVLIFNACSKQDSGKELPFLGRKQIVEKKVDGRVVKDTVPHKIPEFRFIDQDSSVVTPNTFEDKIYVADFFFTTCPGICPTMAEQMKRVYKEYKDNPKVMFLSHTVDPRHDTPAVLDNYAEKLGVDTDKWKFVTHGGRDYIYKIGKEGYMVSSGKDSTAPGGFLHSGQFFLVDDKRRIRGVYMGTKPKSVDKLINDIAVLLRNRKE